MIQTPIRCVSKNHTSKSQADYMIFIGSIGYGVCKFCFKWFSKTHQLILEDWTKKLKTQ